MYRLYNACVEVPSLFHIVHYIHLNLATWVSRMYCSRYYTTYICQIFIVLELYTL